MRVLIADDEATVRRALRLLLLDELGELAVGEAASAAEAIALAERSPWDLAILDLQMPGGSGLDAIAPLRALWPELRVVVVSALPEEAYAPLAERAGAHAFVPKLDMVERLGTVVRALLGRGA